MIQYNHDHENEVTLFAETNFRNQRRRFGIKTDDRRRHMYIIGKTGMGKTALQENIILADIYAGHGCCYIDPHGDTAEKLIDFIPPHRVNDIVYFNPADIEYPLGFNILETENDEEKPLIASGLMGVFKKIWPDVWSPRMEYILMNCVLALLDFPGATLLGINRLLVDKEYRARVIAKIRDPIVKTFWVAEFTSWSEKYATEAIAPVQNKVGQFLSSSVIRNIVAQVKSTMNLRRIMDDGKILIVNLSKGRIGEDNMRLLGGMLITKLQLAAQERQNMKEEERRDFYLFVDEFQNFANESFASILSEARKYRLNLVVAHQYIEQLDEKVAPAIFGNVGTIITFRVGGEDATAMEQEFFPTFTPEDLVNLAKFQIYLKLMVDGVATPPFSANTLPPIADRMNNAAKVIAVSRERYAEPRQVIEAKVLQWSGMEVVKTGEGEGEMMYTGGVKPVQFQYPEVKTAEEREQSREQEHKRTEEKIEESKGEEKPEEEKEYLSFTPDRLAAIQSAAPKQNQKKPKFPHICSRCGKMWHLAVQLDPSRPMYCPECRPIVAEERKRGQSQMREMLRTPPPPDREMGSDQADADKPNRPRIVHAENPVKIVAPLEEKEPNLFEEIAKAKGQPIEKRKHELEKRADTPPARRRDRRRGGGGPSEGVLPRDQRPPAPPRPPTPSQPRPQPPAPPKPRPQPPTPPSGGQPLNPGDRIKFE